MNFRAQVEVTIRFFAFVSLFVLVFSLNAVAQEGQDPESGVQDEQTERLSSVEEGSYTLRTMLVTATKRVQLAQDVPFSLNVQSEDDIKRLNTSDLEDLSRNVAGLSIQNLGPGQSQVSIRGVSSGEIVRDQPGVKGQIGVYMDEVPISLSLFTPDIDLFDMKRVETLRGPQGTLFGAGSIGGTIRFISNQPILNETETKAEFNIKTIDGGSEGGHVKVALNAPLGDTLATRIVAYGTGHAGFIDAYNTAGELDEDINEGNRYGGRIAFLWQPVESFSITPRVLYQQVNSDGFNRQEEFNLLASANHYPEAPSTPVQLAEREQFLVLNEAFEDETLIFDAVINWELSDSIDTTYVFSYSERDILVSRDSGALVAGITGSPSSDGADSFLSYNLRDSTDFKLLTHELRFSSNHESIQWLGGFFYSDADRNYAQRLYSPGYDDINPSADDSRNGFTEPDSPYISYVPYDIRQFALFGEATYLLTERLGFTAGLRWYDWKEERTFAAGGPFSSQDNRESETGSSGFTPRFIANYAVTDQLTVNAQASQGFRLGGSNDPLNEPNCGPGDFERFSKFVEYDDETLWNYEIGIKSLFKSVMVNASAFYIDISDLQVTTDAGACSSRVSIGVPEAHTIGGELEMSTYITDAFLLTFAGSYADAKFDSTIEDSEGNVQSGIKKGNRLPSVPKWQFSASGMYTLPGFLKASKSYLSASWQFAGERITQPSDQNPGAGMFTNTFVFGDLKGGETREADLTLDAYHILNLSSGLTYDNLELVLYVKNVTDTNAHLAYDREPGTSAGRSGYLVNQPRTFGLTVRWSM